MQHIPITIIVQPPSQFVKATRQDKMIAAIHMTRPRTSHEAFSKFSLFWAWAPGAEQVEQNHSGKVFDLQLMKSIIARVRSSPKLIDVIDSSDVCYRSNEESKMFIYYNESPADGAAALALGSGVPANETRTSVMEPNIKT